MHLSRWVLGVGGVLAVSLALPVAWSSARTQAPAHATAGIKVGMISTVSAVIGDEELPTGLHTTTPPAPVRCRWCRQR